MKDRSYNFLQGVLGADGAQALRKAAQKEARIGAAVVPRAILSWITLAARFNYEGEIPGVDNTYLTFKKTEGPGYSGAVSLGKEVYGFENADIFHVAGAVAVALGIEDTRVSPQVRDMTIQRLGKSIDTLVKARVAIRELEKKVLDPSSGYQIHHEQAEVIPGMPPLLRVKATAPNGEVVGHALFTDHGQHIQPGTVGVHEDHQRRGLASAMYAHAEKITGKKLVPSKMQTDEGAALWAGNQAQKQFGAPALKTELPGTSHKPTPHAEASQPAAPEFQTQQPKPPPKRGPLSMKVSKSQAGHQCSLCRRPQIKDGSFVGCFCFSSLAKSVKCTPSDSGYTLEFQSVDWDADAIYALKQALIG